MGISNLLPSLKSITEKVHVKAFSGLRAAIDTYGWLHRGTYSCATEICLHGDSDKYVRFCLARARMLQQHNVTPIFVFDGGFLPIKGNKEQEREEKRESAKQQGLVLHRSGNTSGAHQAFTKAVDVTPEMAYNLILELKARGIAYVVAPYEADAQLAYLAKNNLCDLVISEDSDCIPFGCSKVLFKLDAQGNGELLETSKLHRNKGINLSRFTSDMVIDMCILAGCDYLPSVGGMGVKKAHSFVQQYKDTKKILRGVRFSAAFDVPRDYEQRFLRARMAFKHQRVFNSLATSNAPIQSVPLNPFPSDVDETTTDYLGPPLPDDVAKSIAIGELNPLTKQPIQRIQLITHEPSELVPTKASPKHVEPVGRQGMGKDVSTPNLEPKAIKRKRPTNRPQSSIDSFMYKTSESAAAAFKQPRTSGRSENSLNEGNVAGTSRKSKHFGGSSEPTPVLNKQPLTAQQVEVEEDPLEGELYQSDLVSRAFRPLPVANMTKVASLRQALHACNGVSPQHNQDRNSTSPVQASRNKKPVGRSKPNAFFQSYKFTATTGLSRSNSSFYETDENEEDSP